MHSRHAMHVHLPAAFPVCPCVERNARMNFLLKAAKLTRTGIGLPAYYNDEVIIPALMNRGADPGGCQRATTSSAAWNPRRPARQTAGMTPPSLICCRPLELGIYQR